MDWARPDITLRLGHDPHGVAAVRRAVCDLIAPFAEPDVVQDAMLIASELVTNAFLHTDGGCTVRAECRPPIVRIEVTDTSATMPQLRAATDEWRADGRGLTIVANLAAQWGAERIGTGKVVWAELHAQTKAC